MGASIVWRCQPPTLSEVVSVFERFTNRARRVVVLSQEEARLLNHDYIGTEHILLGLIHEGEGVAAKALESLGISLEGVRQQVEEIIGRGQQAPGGHIPFTPRAKTVLELSLREALQLGHNHIGTEHLLLGLIREGDGVAAQILVRFGAQLARVREQVIELLSGYAVPATAAVPPEPRPTPVPAPAPSAYENADIDVEVAQEIAKIRREKEAAIDAQDFERAAHLRDDEKELLRRQAQRDSP
jgi:ATP-dependent Clp protease ATP-binding subunit ClpC